MILEIKVPKIGESISEVTLSKIHVANGTYVAQDTLLCEFESDKTSFELLSEKAGTVNFIATEGSDLKIGDLVCTIDTSAQNNNPKITIQPVAETIQQNNNTQTTTKINYASPAASKIINENNIATTQITATGKDGRITKADAIQAIENKTTTQLNTETIKNQEQTTTISLQTSPNTQTPNRQETKEKLSRLRKTISKRLVESKNTTAMLTTFNEVDLTEIMALRKKYKENFEKKYGTSLGFMPFFIRAAAIALLENPPVNAYIDDENIYYHNYVDISVAVSTEKGLVVPVLRNVETMTLLDIEQGIANLAKKARENTLTMDDMTGGTFTVSNGGVFGSLMSTPIINPPQSAILGMHKIQERPMVINSQIAARPMMYLALSYDHRIIDGKEAVTFLVRIKELLEDPMKIFLSI